MRYAISLCLIALIAIGCGGGPATSSPQPSVNPQASSASQTPLVRLGVKIAIGAESLSDTTAWVAKGADIFAKAGLDVFWAPVTPTASITMGRLITGEVDVIVAAADALFNAVAADRDVKMFGGGPIGFKNYITISKAKADEFAKSGVTPTSPIADRIKALRGLIIGSGSASGPGETALQKAFTSVGMDIYKDAQIQSGTPEPQLAAFRAGRLDAIIGSVPNAFVGPTEGWAVSWISGPSKDVLAWNKGYNDTWLTTGSFAKDNPEVLRRVNTGLQMVSDLIEKEPDAAYAALKLKFTALDDKLLRTSFDASKKAYICDPKVKTQILQDAIDSYNGPLAADKKMNKKPADIVVAGFLDNP